MNPQEPRDGSRSEVDTLTQRVHELQQLISLRIEKAKNKRKAYLLGGVILAIACTISMSVLTNLFFKMDAQALTQYGRQEVERQLEANRGSMKSLLESSAPQLTSQAIGALVGSVPHLRPLLTRELDARIRLVTAEFEDRLTNEMKSAIAASKENLDKEFKGLSDSQKVEKLVMMTAAQFNNNIETLLEGLYPKYSEEMNRIKDYLIMLRDKDPSKLTDREKVQKELIQTLLRLMAREKNLQLKH
jgi:hypothetical protein